MTLAKQGIDVGIDVIGDVHGYADHLRALLEQMGYRESRGAYRHRNRTALFVGDLIDRGPKQIEVYRLVRAMCEAGTAQCVLGNHEFNAIGWVRTDPKTQQPLRAHNDSHWRQHRAFLEQVGSDGSPLHVEMIDWFETLPLWVETDDIRVVHACWHDGSRRALDNAVDAEGRLTPNGLTTALTRGTAAYQAIDVLLKGPEVRLPDGISFVDAEGTQRRQARVKWWSPDATTYRTAAIMGPDLAHQLPDTELPDRRFSYSDRKPVFFGHYWLSGEPRVECSVAVCLDYSIAKDGALVAYRWSGEDHLTPENIKSVT